ncbi:MAG TPA: hypothetical protein PK033_07490 [Acetivibrio sp.]|nr:hypothetical protein [Clostridium sp.]HOQ36946.1 hypothetical protein [Acetivibrio sp.]HQA57706.1 hypothetical protein [Acetivibrio sp.]
MLMKNYGNSSVKRFLLSVSAAVLILGTTTGCKLDINKAIADNSYNRKDSGTAAEQGVNLERIKEQYRALLQNKSSLTEIIKFLDANVSQVSSDIALMMVDEFEKRQKEFLPELEKKFTENGEIQSKMAEAFLEDFDIGKIYSIEDYKVQELLKETKEKGYKVETAEGMFFPVINYEIYKKYSDYVTDDFREYINIMAAESNRAPAKDAALVISWEEVLERALNQEKFIKLHPDSIRINHIKDLHKKYINFTLFGLNNTPLFSYDSSTMDSEAKQAYMDVLKSNTDDSDYITILRDYMSLLEENDYKLTDDVKKYREEAVRKLDL